MCEHPGCPRPVFGTDRLTKKGYCKYHQSKRTDRKPIKRTFSASSKKVNQGKIRTYVKKNQLFEDANSEKRKDLEAWFERTMKIVDKNPYCWECGKYIPKSFYRAACAHILPKRKTYGFPSVSTHELNFLVLGAGCGCHAKFDNSWDDASKMKVWNIALERIKIMLPDVSEGEIKNLPPQIKP